MYTLRAWYAVYNKHATFYHNKTFHLRLYKTLTVCERVQVVAPQPEEALGLRLLPLPEWSKAVKSVASEAACSSTRPSHFLEVPSYAEPLGAPQGGRRREHSWGIAKGGTLPVLHCDPGMTRKSKDTLVSSSVLRCE